MKTMILAMMLKAGCMNPIQYFCTNMVDPRFDYDACIEWMITCTEEQRYAFHHCADFYEVKQVEIKL